MYFMGYGMENFNEDNIRRRIKKTEKGKRMNGIWIGLMRRGYMDLERVFDDEWGIEGFWMEIVYFLVYFRFVRSEGKLDFEVENKDYYD